MGWIFAIAVLILLAGFRKFALALVVLVAAGGGIYYLHDQRQEEQEERSKSRILPSQVAISGGHINLQYGMYDFTGRITNNSPEYTLTQLELAVTVKDCVANSAPQSCVIIGDISQTMYINVPPGQARDFDQTLYFTGGEFAPKGVLNWQYNVSQTWASPADA